MKDGGGGGGGEVSELLCLLYPTRLSESKNFGAHTMGTVKIVLSLGRERHGPNTLDAEIGMATAGRRPLVGKVL
jgi:hypothetical protein